MTRGNMRDATTTATQHFPIYNIIPDIIVKFFLHISDKMSM